APEAESNSAFQAAPWMPPAIMARRPSSAKNTGSRASCSIRGGRASGSMASGDLGVVSVAVIGGSLLCMKLLGHDALDLRQAGAALGAGAERLADVCHAR